MTNIVAVLIVRCRHTGVYADGRPNVGSVTLYDLDEITIQKNRTRYVPIPAGAIVDIPMSTRTLTSWHAGDIDKLTRLGVLEAELIFQLRDKSNCGGPGGTGQSLQPVVLNAERLGNELRLVLPNNGVPVNLDSVGFLAGEAVEITGLSGNFRSLNGLYSILMASPGMGLGGPAVGSYLITMVAPGPNIPAATLAGVNVCLSNGRVVAQFNGQGDVGGLGNNAYGYIGGQLFPHTESGATVTVLKDSFLIEPVASSFNFLGNGIEIVAPGLGVVEVTGSSDTLLWGNLSVASNTTTRYLNPSYVPSIAPLTPIQYRVVRAGTIRNMRIHHNSPSGNGNLVTYTLRTNAAPTALSVSMASTAPDGNDLINTATVAAGDLLDIEISKGASIGDGNIDVISALEFGS